jgi:hypothetical protein
VLCLHAFDKQLCTVVYALTSSKILTHNIVFHKRHPKIAENQSGIVSEYCMCYALLDIETNDVEFYW